MQKGRSKCENHPWKVWILNRFVPVQRRNKHIGLKNEFRICKKLRFIFGEAVCVASEAEAQPAISPANKSLSTNISRGANCHLRGSYSCQSPPLTSIRLQLHRALPYFCLCGRQQHWAAHWRGTIQSLHPRSSPLPQLFKKNSAGPFSRRFSLRDRILTSSQKSFLQISVCQNKTDLCKHKKLTELHGTKCFLLVLCQTLKHSIYVYVLFIPVSVCYINNVWVYILQ